MVAIPFPRSSLPGQSAQEGQGRLVNAFVDKDGDLFVWRRSPGLVAFTDAALSGPRGFLEVAGFLYGAWDDTAAIVDAGGGVTVLDGVLTGGKPVTWARNNAPTPDVAVVTEEGVFVVSTTTVSSYPDGDLPQANSVSFLDGFFLFTIADGRIYASDLNAPAVDALSFAKAEAKPDGLLRGVVSGQYFYAFGPSSFERWRNVGTSPFPLARDGVVPVGIAGPWAIAGYEDGWDGNPIFVASDSTVRELNGFQANVISTRYIERIIAAVPDKTQLHATVYVVGGHAYWSLSSPEWTWVYDITAQAWHERRSYGLENWRYRHAVKAFDRWIVGDTHSTSLLTITEQSLTEDGSPLAAVIESGPVKQFPARVAVKAAWFDFVVGQGDARSASIPENDPQVAIQWSHDGGVTWSDPILRSLGRQGESRRQIRVNRLGLTTHHGIRFRLTVSDPVYVSLMGGEVEADARTP
ncbi:hypothetical protein [Microvirga sp. TS319]|uniref:hypothetical protein n=1 Tax=Microvirga sp. TS319 TaxID=3241165 RepID=UPI003519FCE6